MKAKLYINKLKNEFDRIEILFWAHLSFIILTIILEITKGLNGASSILFIIPILFFYKFFYKTQKNLYYSFWTFYLITVFYVLSELWAAIYAYQSFLLAILNLLTLGILAAHAYILTSPIFYPRVSWWEYDFRYRDDLKVNIELLGEELEGRLSDVRRNAGCVSLFKDIEVGSILNISANFPDEIKIQAEIFSKRQYSIGRPYFYGVKFITTGHDDKLKFNQFICDWKKHSLKTREKKYEKSA